MKITDMPYYNRPGYRLKNQGVSFLNDAELLAIILSRGNKYENAIDLANRLLKKYNLNKLAELSVNELKKEVKNEIKAYQILALLELSKRYSKLTKKGYVKSIRNPRDIYNMFVDELSDLSKEKVLGVYLDINNRILKYETLSIGILNTSIIHPREVFKGAIKESANSIILIHNHPSGNANPSEDDVKITNILINAGNIMGIKLLDHIIIGKNCFYSFKENSLIKV